MATTSPAFTSSRGHRVLASNFMDICTLSIDVRGGNFMVHLSYEDLAQLRAIIDAARLALTPVKEAA